MAIYRIHKEDNFVIIDKAFLLNEEISLKAKGLLALLLSYPDNWQFYKAEIVQHTTDKENSLNSGLKELIENGYIVRKQRKDENGKFEGYEYHVYEKPSTEKPSTEKPSTEKPSTEKPSTEKPSTEKPILLNNKNTKNKNTKTTPSPELVSEFKEWYSKYPHPRNEQQTMKNYINTRKTYSAEQLMTALNNYLATIEAEDPEYAARLRRRDNDV